jgi:hypothetical protein
LKPNELLFVGRETGLSADREGLRAFKQRQQDQEQSDTESVGPPRRLTSIETSVSLRGLALGLARGYVGKKSADREGLRTLKLPIEVATVEVALECRPTAQAYEH